MKIGKNTQLFFWALYDWGSSGFASVVQTFVLAAYFTRYVAADEAFGGYLWGLTTGMAGLFIAIAAPFLGAIADHTGNRKTWLGLFTALAIVSCSSLWFILPSPDYTAAAMLLLAVGTIGAELAFIFYSAMLPGLAGRRKAGQWSGWGWALGYAGGLACLLGVYLLILAFGESAAVTRASFPFTAAWYAFFSLPVFLFTEETRLRRERFQDAVQKGIDQLKNTLLQTRKYRDILLFLIARLFYINGLTTLFIYGGIFPSAAYGMDPQEVLLFGIVLSVSSGLGAFSFAKVDDRIGSKKLILFSLAALLIFSMLIIRGENKTLFWIFAFLAGIFVGPVQAASRSYIARAAPKELRNEMFGFLALSGKATAFLGPLLVAGITWLTGSLRAGMSIIPVLFAVGFWILLHVKEAKP